VNCLIVDDEPRICYGLQDLIDWEALGVEVRDVAFSAREAIAMHREKKYSLIITDIKMPIVDGLSMQPVDTLREGDLVAMAVRIGTTRLIDNFIAGDPLIEIPQQD
jgi:YesN/AraC family two-component response regulator